MFKVITEVTIHSLALPDGSGEMPFEGERLPLVRDRESDVFPSKDAVIGFKKKADAKAVAVKKDKGLDKLKHMLR